MVTTPVPRAFTPSRIQFSSGFDLDGRDMELLSKFEVRTLVTVNGAKSINFLTKELFNFACTVSLSDTLAIFFPKKLTAP